MSLPFYDNEYEALCCVMSQLDAAQQHLEDFADWEDEMQKLYQIRKRINDRRLTLLGNGGDRPFNVDDLKLV